VGYTYSNNATAVAERWDGKIWTAQSVPLPPDAIGDSQLRGVSCTQGGSCEGVGFYTSGTTGRDVTLAEGWNGTAWTVQTTPVFPANYIGNDFFAVSCPASNYCEAVGFNADQYGFQVNLIEAWDGTSWTQQPVSSPSPINGTQLYGVSCTAPTACEAVGGSSIETTEITTAYSWNGTSWSSETPPSPSTLGSGLLGISCYGPGTCEAVGLSDKANYLRVKPLAMIRT
jgi:hypothetical protein